MSDRTCSLPGCDRPYRANGLCNAHHMRRKQGSRLDDSAPVRESDSTGAVRLANNVVRDENGCLLWTKPLNYAGYGHLRVEGRIVGAHRVAYANANGAIPSGLEIDHLCRVRNCVNPDHLEAVTHDENLRRARDRARKDAVA